MNSVKQILSSKKWLELCNINPSEMNICQKQELKIMAEFCESKLLQENNEKTIFIKKWKKLNFIFETNPSILTNKQRNELENMALFVLQNNIFEEPLNLIYVQKILDSLLFEELILDQNKN